MLDKDLYGQTQKYPTYPEIHEIPGNNQKYLKGKRYPEIPDRIFQHTYPTRIRPATRYFVQYPTRPNPILKKPTRWPLYITLYIQPKKQFEIQIIGILDVIGSFI